MPVCLLTGRLSGSLWQWQAAARDSGQYGGLTAFANGPRPITSVRVGFDFKLLPGTAPGRVTLPVAEIGGSVGNNGTAAARRTVRLHGAVNNSPKGTVT